MTEFQRHIIIILSVLAMFLWVNGSRADLTLCQECGATMQRGQNGYECPVCKSDNDTQVSCHHNGACSCSANNRDLHSAYRLGLYDFGEYLFSEEKEQQEGQEQQEEQELDISDEPFLFIKLTNLGLLSDYADIETKRLHRAVVQLENEYQRRYQSKHNSGFSFANGKILRKILLNEERFEHVDDDLKNLDSLYREGETTHYVVSVECFGVVEFYSLIFHKDGKITLMSAEEKYCYNLTMVQLYTLFFHSGHFDISIYRHKPPTACGDNDSGQSHPLLRQY